MRSATKKRVGKDLSYLTWLRTQPCLACASLGNQMTPTEAAHTGVRGLSQKGPDREAIPLCSYHHRLGSVSHHRLGKRFWDHHGIDRERMISNLNEKFQEEVCQKV